MNIDEFTTKLKVFKKHHLKCLDDCTHIKSFYQNLILKN
jgi:hypothetical protein